MYMNDLVDPKEPKNSQFSEKGLYVRKTIKTGVAQEWTTFKKISN